MKQAALLAFEMASISTQRDHSQGKIYCQQRKEAYWLAPTSNTVCKNAACNVEHALFYGDLGVYTNRNLILEITILAD